MATASARAPRTLWKSKSQANTRIPHLRPRPGRRRRRWHLIAATKLPFFPTILLVLFILSTPTLAQRTPSMPEARVNDILFDPRPAPEPRLYRRQFNLGSSTSSKGVKPTSSRAAAATTTTTGLSSTGIETAPTLSPSALPRAFDGGLGTNYTQPSCPSFLKQMIRNDTFTACLPNSASFFAASRSPSTLDPVLSASCGGEPPACSSLMTSYASTLRSNSACSDDYNRQNPLVRQAYNGLLSYDIVYRAICLKAQPSAQNNQSSDYCYTNAVTNMSSPTDSYVYYLPLGVDLPAGSMPTCSQCLKDTMDVFSATASNKTQPITLTYVNAAQMVNLQCGPNFVNQSIPGASGKSAAAINSPSGRVWTASLTALVGIIHVLGAL
ncbi:MAG: hypothetical protein Q9217_006937 [Psora testacea]